MSKQMVVFVANHGKTKLFERLSHKLIKSGFNIGWISVNDQQTKLIRNNVPQSKFILQLKFDDQKNCILEKDDFQFVLNDLVISDKFLREYKNKGISFLKNAAGRIVNKLAEYDDLIFIGELAWAHERLIHRLISNNLISGKYFCLHTCRIPNGRFMIFTNDKHTTYIKRSNPENVFDMKKDIIDYLDIRKKPDYFENNRELVKSKMQWRDFFKRAIIGLSGRNRDRNDPTNLHFSAFKLGAMRLQQHIQSLRVAKFLDKHYVNKAPENYRIYTLHKQPEASIDVQGEGCSDQMANILNIWKTLLPNEVLLVKEHSNAVGDRPIGFFKRLLCYPNIDFIHYDANLDDWISDANAVVTVTGTAALETWLRGGNGICLADTFFNQAGENETLVSSRSERIHEYAEIVKHSFIGYVNSPEENSSVLEEANLDRVVTAILEAASQN